MKNLDFISSVFNGVIGITLLGSAACNLNCKYCFNSTEDKQLFAKLNEDIISAWKNNTYVDSVLKTLCKLSIRPENIQRCSFSGGEPFLYTHLVESGIKSILDAFPNLNRFNFTTNLTKPNEIINVISAVATSTDRPITLYFACSVDGPEGSALQQKGHNVSWDIYKENLQKISHFITYGLDGVPRKDGYRGVRLFPIKFVLSSTVDKDVYLEYFSNDDNLNEYISYIHEKTGEIKGIFNTGFTRVSVTPPNIAYPQRCTAEEGERLRQIFEKWDRLKLPKFLHDNRWNADELLSLANIITNWQYQEIIDMNVPCAEFIINPIFLPSGNIVDCPPHLRVSLQNSYKSKRVGVSLENIIDPDVLWALRANTLSDLASLSYTYGLIDELSIAGQIPFKYYGNYNLKLDAVKNLRRGMHCTASNIEETGFSNLIYAGKLRMYLNGVHDYIDEIYSDRRNQILTKFSDKLLDLQDFWK